MNEDFLKNLIETYRLKNDFNKLRDSSVDILTGLLIIDEMAHGNSDGIYLMASIKVLLESMPSVRTFMDSNEVNNDRKTEVINYLASAIYEDGKKKITSGS